MVNTVAILSDFGNRDAYSGIMKGVMLGINSNLKFIDITNAIEPYNILSAAYLLYTAWDYFPEQTTFLSVVDPGVGSDRKVLISCLDNKYLITPDNGTVSMLNRMKDGFFHFNIKRNAIEKALSSNSHTFHGRDIFAPMAANLATYGIDVITAKEIAYPVLLPEVNPVISEQKGMIKGTIIHIDRFGNCISNIHEEDLEKLPEGKNIEVHINNHIIHHLSQYFSQVSRGCSIAYIGSSDFLEIGIREGSAEKQYKIKCGTEFTIKKV